ncbi:glycoside hydrolase family 16 protein [Polaribacter sp. M15]
MKSYLIIFFIFGIGVASCERQFEANKFDFEDIQDTNINLENSYSEYSPDKREPLTYSGYELVWNEEFDVDATSVDLNDWNIEQGFKRNEELQWYQNNTTIKEHTLIIEARKETVSNPNYNPSSSDWKKNRASAEYTSTSITTRGKHSWKYGRLEVRAKIPTEKGAWPAIWTLGTNGEWPSNGEVDILEMYLKNGNPSILANFAWGTNQRWKASWNSYTKPLSEFIAADPDWKNKFHVWRMDWDANTMSIYLDDVFLNSHSTQQLNATTNFGGVNKPFNQKHHLLLNLAIGSNGGNPDQTQFPLQYVIDYVRLYQ